MKAEPHIVRWDKVEIHLVPENDSDYGVLRTLAGNEKITQRYHYDGSVTVVGEGD